MAVVDAAAGHRRIWLKWPVSTTNWYLHFGWPDPPDSVLVRSAADDSAIELPTVHVPHAYAGLTGRGQANGRRFLFLQQYPTGRLDDAAMRIRGRGSWTAQTARC